MRSNPMWMPNDETALAHPLATVDELLGLGDAFLELAPDWRIVRVNSGQERLSRTPRSESLGRSFWDVWPETASPDTPCWREYHRCMDERVPVQFDEYHAPLDLWTGVTAHPLSTGGIAIFFRDVTAEKRVENELRAERDFTDVVVDTLATLVVVLDPEGNIVRFNSACERATGYSAPEVRGRSVFDLLIPQADLAGARGAFGRLRVGDFPNQHRNRWRMKDGSERLIDWSNTAIADEQGRVRFIIGTGIDITDGEQVRETLRDSEERFRSVFESAAVGIGRVSLDGRFLQVNEAYARLVGYAREELVELGFQAITHPDDVEEDVRHLADLVAGRIASYEMDKRYVRKDGSLVWVSLSVGLARDAQGRPSYCSVVVKDISARKRAQEALQQSRAELKRAAEALREANDQLRETDRRRTEFLGVLSHELRNPLAPIRNSIFLLDRVAGDTPQATRARQVIRRQTEHLTRLVDDLLDVTRISRGKIQLKREIVDLRNLVRRTCEDHRALFEDAGVEMRLDFPVKPLWANVDPTRIAQVIGNLLGNANKFTPAGGTVKVVLRDREGHACIGICDSGIGMEPGRVAYMFEPFTQEDRGLARTRGGLGLGLALARGLIELHGGTLTARSEGPGKGSEFELTVPLVGPVSRPDPSQPLADAPSPAPSGRRVVVVIEDNCDAARTLADVLELAGHRVTIARDGRSGIALARRDQPDVIVCDLGLPDVDGYEVARTLREDPALAGARLIALSGYAQPEDVARSKEAGFDAHLPKPAPLDELEDLLA